MSCELTASVLHGYLDGELDAARAADFERHLVSCPECVRVLEAQENLRAGLQSAGLYERAPSALRDKVYADVGASVRVSPSAMLRPRPWRWFALATALLLLALVSWRVIPQFRSTHDETALASAILDAHLRSLQPGHLEDVVSSDQHTIKPWFDGKLDFAPPVRDFSERGFPLQGARLDVLHGRTVAVLVYGRRKHLVNVFVWPTNEPDAPAASGSQLGYNWVNWRKNSMEMWAVSDVNPADLDELQRLFQ